ncbi:hypothetical protein CPLU01_09927 [Colletotrichum plurivorum]|uniref:Uncharacterized protein n=1 Tax=Colletotrichum plurivorum TaxID=2175906 RepID=A0A8H6K7Q5_9PEZI|nr:hypothetical protein CPLU01_09927 [Colletotrichum plurivorum]
MALTDPREPTCQAQANAPAVGTERLIAPTGPPKLHVRPPMADANHLPCSRQRGLEPSGRDVRSSVRGGQTLLPPKREAFHPPVPLTCSWPRIITAKAIYSVTHVYNLHLLFRLHRSLAS